MPPSGLAQWQTALTPRLTPYIPETLTPKQVAFLLLTDVPELFFGGGAGSAKSWALLFGALQYVDVPGYNAMIIRKNFAQLAKPGALMDVANTILKGTAARWNANRHQWTFPSGATLTFSHLATAGAIENYQSAQVQYIAVDEVTDFDEATYTFLFSRLRKPAGLDVPLRMRTASNPIGRGIAWVKKRFVKPETRVPGAVFMPAYIDDNPYLDRESYVESLRQLHPVRWRQLLLGDWDVSEAGEIFQPRVWLADGGLVEKDQLARGKYMSVRYWDLAATEPSAANPDPDWTAGVRMSRSLDTGMYVVEHVRRFRRTSGQVRKEVRSLAKTDGARCLVGIEQDPGQAGKDQVEDYRKAVLPGYRVADDTRPTGDKTTRASRFAGAMENGLVQVVLGDWNDDYFDELEGFPSGAHDDQVDASSGAYKILRRRSTVRSGTGAALAGTRS